MPQHVKLRALTEAESQAVKRLVASRTVALRRVQRAKIIAAMLAAPTLKAATAGLRAGYRSRQVGPLWVKRFNAERLVGLADRPRTICVDELGPLAAKTYPGEEWVRGRNRAICELDYGRRGVLWVLGAFEPATGAATIWLSPRRDSASYIQLLEKMITTFPADRWLVITDNLSTHRSRETRLALAAWPEIRTLFIPKYACGLNLSEPWWKQ